MGDKSGKFLAQGFRTKNYIFESSNYLNMKYVLIFFTIVFSLNIFSQSKKEQIVILNNRLDSLNREYEKDTTLLNEDLRKLKNQFNTLSKEQKEAEKLLDKKSRTIKNKNEKIQEYITKNKELQSELNVLRATVKQTQFHEVKFPQDLINTWWSVDCDPDETRGNIYFGTNVIKEGDVEKEMIEIGGYEWGGDVLRTESNNTNDNFKVYFVRTDPYEHDNNLQIFEFNWVNKQLIVDGLPLMNCKERLDDKTNEKEDYTISNDILKYGVPLDQLNDPSYISSYYPMPDFNNLKGVTDGDFLTDDFELTIGEQGWSGAPKDGIRYYSDGRYAGGDMNFFKDYEFHGPYLYWRDNGNLTTYRSYIEGRLNGYEYEWYENGKLKYMKYYDNKGLEQGGRIGFHKNGQISLKAQFIDGTANGSWVRYYENGEKEKSGEMVNNQKDGIWKHWDASGNLTCVVDWKKDELFPIVDKIQLSCYTCFKCHPFNSYVNCTSGSALSCKNKLRKNKINLYQISYNDKTHNLKVEFSEDSFEPEIFIDNRRIYNHLSYIVKNDIFIFEYKDKTKDATRIRLNVNEETVSCSGCSVSLLNN
tara:strand:- start:109 stop:1875 length:1767 start_codon:yes stop_codon:yes gene_type:complete